MTSIYVASSWRNAYQPAVVEALRAGGFTVYDFRHPLPGDDGFSWQQVDQDWKPGDKVTLDRWHAMSSNPVARKGFHLDYGAMHTADGCVLVLPAGRSAHLEAGFFHGMKKQLVVLMPEPQEPDLMYLMANAVVGTIPEVVTIVKTYFRMF